MFDDAWRNLWNSTAATLSLSTDQHYDGSTSILLRNLKGYNGVYLSRDKYWQTNFDPIASGYTHIEFKARVGSLDADRTYFIAIGGPISNGTWVSFPAVDLSSPAYSNEQPTTDARWSVIRVPLSDFKGLESGFNLAGMYIAHRSGSKLLEGYFDGIQLVSMTTSKSIIPW